MMGRTAETLFRLRLASGLTQQQTGQLLGLSIKSVVAYESGTERVPAEVSTLWMREIGAIVRRARGVKTQGCPSPRVKRMPEN